MRSDNRTDDVMGGTHIGYPIPEGLAGRIFQGTRAGYHLYYLCPKQLHSKHVEGLAVDIFLAHVDGTLKSEESTRGSRGNSVLAGSRLGDDAALAHALGQQNLAHGVVHLVGAGVAEVLPLDVDFRSTQLAGHPLGEIERRRATDVLPQIVVQLGGELGVVLRLFVLGRKLVQRGDQRLRHEPSAELAEVTHLVGHLRRTFWH